MASKSVRSAVQSVVEDPNLDIELVVANEAAVTAFDKFSNHITTKMESICQSCLSYKSFSTIKTSMWQAFHQLRVEGLPKMWKYLVCMSTYGCN